MDGTSLFPINVMQKRIGQLAQKWGLKKQKESWVKKDAEAGWKRGWSCCMSWEQTEWRHVGGRRNFCVVLNLSWRLSKERDGRGNGSVAEREICHLLNSSWVCAWDSPGVNQVQTWGEEGNQIQSLRQPSQRGQDPGCKGRRRFQEGKHDQLCQSHMWALIIHQLLIWKASLSLHPFLHQAEELALAMSAQASQHSGLGWDCFQNATYLLCCLRVWDGGFLRGIPTCTQGWSDSLKLNGRQQKFLIICCKLS